MRATPPAPDAFSPHRAAARDLGFEVVAIAPAGPFPRDGARLRAWCEAREHGDMAYMARTAAMRADPAALVPDAAWTVTVAVDYHADAAAFASERRFGRVARYAWGRDYHDVVLPRLRALAARFEALAGGPLAHRCVVDAEPLLERAAAARAGLGFFGKNTCVILPRRGSWFFLGEIVVAAGPIGASRDAPPPPRPAPVAVGCGTCRRCLDACPTNAFTEPWRLDARLCISYLTIEAKGPIPVDLRTRVGAWVFGCDVCQDVCPFNRFASDGAWPELRPEAGVGPRLDLVATLSIATDEEFRARFRGTPLLRPKRRGLLRNAAVAAANVGCDAAVPALEERAGRDPEALVRGHALTALAALAPGRARAPADRARAADPDPFVRDEAERILALTGG